MYSNNFVASGEIKHISNTHITVQKITGEFNTSGSISDNESGAATTVSNTTVLNISIPDDVASYWAPVYAYQHEEVLNESKRHIRVIDRAYVGLIEDDFAGIF